MSLTTPEKTRTLQRKLYRKGEGKKPPRRGRLRPELFSVCLTMKLVGKPDAGNRHVRFDERGQETECCHMAQATAPVLDSTLSLRDFIKCKCLRGEGHTSRVTAALGRCG